MQRDLFSKEALGIELQDVFRAYFDCRKNKRNKKDAMLFEINFEKEVIALWREINSKSYVVSPSWVFIIQKPVKREIFAAQFRDRIIHHLIVNKINSFFEKEFIYDTYSCRKGKGTHFGVNRAERFIRQCSENYQKECWVLKLDVRGYFMHIHKQTLWVKLKPFILKNYQGKDVQTILWIIQEIIKNNPTKGCIFKSFKRKWSKLPKSKSLFYSPIGCGLPVGNFTNQVFANFYLNSLDHFIKNKLKVRYYSRYVDDFLIISKNKKELKLIIPKIESFLFKNLKLRLHPRKIYLQNHTKGVEFLGFFLKPKRRYVSKRFQANLHLLIKKRQLNDFQINSILSHMSHANHFKSPLRNLLIKLRRLAP